MRESTKGLLKAAVLTVGVADCIGVYVAQHRLTQPVPADIQYDVAYASYGKSGVFRPDQGMPTLGTRVAVAGPQTAHPVSAKLADAQAIHTPAIQTKPAAAKAPPATVQSPRFALVAPAIAPIHHAGTAPAPGSVRLARNDAPAGPAALHHPAHHSAHGAAAPGASTPGGASTLAGLVPSRHHDRLFADAFGSGFANVPLDAPITQQLDDAPGQSGLADDGTADMQLAHNGGGAPAVNDGAAESGAGSELPPTGMTVTLPDTDKL